MSLVIVKRCAALRIVELVLIIIVLITNMRSAILFAIVIAAGIVLLQASIHGADAVKSSGTKNQPFGKNSQIQVCGTYFCASDPSTSKSVNPEKNKPTQDDLNALLNRMDKIHKQHKQQLSDKWRLMTNAEKIEFLQQMNQMMTKMESVDMAEHMKTMLGDEHDTSHANMKHNVHDSKKSKKGN